MPSAALRPPSPTRTRDTDPERSPHPPKALTSPTESAHLTHRKRSPHPPKALTSHGLCARHVVFERGLWPGVTSLNINTGLLVRPSRSKPAPLPALSGLPRPHATHPPRHIVGPKRTTPSLMPTVNGNTVLSFSTHGQQSAAQGSSTTVSRSDIRSFNIWTPRLLVWSGSGLIGRLIGYITYPI
jgi:hypothetical protein